MSSSKTEIVTACPDPSGSASPTFARNGTHVAYPEVESLSKAGAELGELLATVRSGGYDTLVDEARSRAEGWLDRLERSGEVSDPSLNFRWPHVGGLDGSPIIAATALRELRNAILEPLNPPAEENRDSPTELAETNFPYFKVAKILHEKFGSEYEYLTTRREFWVLLAVYVLPDVILRCYRNTSKPEDSWETTIPVADGIPGAVLSRFALGRRTFYTRDVLARIWWKYHVLCEALGKAPTSDQFRSAADSTWQERTNIYSYPPVVKFTAEQAPASELAKRLNVYLFTRSGHDLTDEQFKEWNKSAIEARPLSADEKLMLEFARSRLNGLELEDGIHRISTPSRLQAYMDVLQAARTNGVDSLPEGQQALLAMLVGLVFYRCYNPGDRYKSAFGAKPKYMRLMRLMSGVPELYEEVQAALAARLARLPVPHEVHGDDFMEVRGVRMHNGEGFTRSEIAALLLCEDVSTPIQHFAEGAKYAKSLGIEMLLLEPGSGKHGYSDILQPPSTIVCSSQDRTRSDSETGIRYKTTGALLFAKEAAPTENTLYYCMGRGTYVSHTGDKPMQITWRTDWQIRPRP